MPETKPMPNQKLRHERERRAWSQQDVADKVGTTPLNVGRWERGVTTPGPYYRQKLCEIFEKTPLELGLLAEYDQKEKTVSVPVQAPISSSTQPSTPLFWNVPYAHNPFFTGRDNVLAQLHDAFLKGQASIAISQPQAVSGLGGIGKTQIAIEYAYRYREHYEAVLWARADSADLLTSDFLLIAALLNLPQRNEQEQHLVVHAVLHWFDTHERWLLILDNADNLEMVVPFLPPSDKGHVLITTRAHSTGTIAGRLELESMTLEEGMLFLLRRSKLLRGATSSLQAVPEALRSQAQAIVEIVNGLPLALDQAAAYIEETGCSPKDYLTFFKTRRSRLLRLRGRNATGHPEPVATTWSLSFERVEQANPAAAELLRLCAFLHPDEMLETMIVEGAAELGSTLQPIAEDEMELNEAIRELHKYSLVKRDPEKKILNIHRLVQAVIKDGMSQETQRVWAERAVRMLSRVFPKSDFAMWPICQQFLPHAQICATLIESWHMLCPEAAHLLSCTGSYLTERARYAEAEPLLQRALAIQQLLDTEHPDEELALTLNYLGELYQGRGELAQAEPYYHQALAIWKQLVGRGHVEQNMVVCLNDLAILYGEWGKYVEAEPFLQQALALSRQLGPQHPSTALTLNNLAALRDRQGRYAEAEPLFQQALAIREKLEAEHPETAMIMLKLAEVYRNQSRYAEAEPLLQRALSIFNQQLGSQHPYTAYSLNDLATIYRNQGRYAEAEPLYQQGLAICEQVMGSQHSFTATVMGNIATLYRNQGRYAEAESLYQRTLAIYERQLGSRHPYTAIVLNHLATLYRNQGRYTEAKPLIERALTIYEQELGPFHLNTANCLNNLAMLYVDQEQFMEAEPLYQRVLTIREQVLGEEHPDVATTLANYAVVLRKTGHEADASQLDARAQAIRTKLENDKVYRDS